MFLTRTVSLTKETKGTIGHFYTADAKIDEDQMFMKVMMVIQYQ